MDREASANLPLWNKFCMHSNTEQPCHPPDMTITNFCVFWTREHSSRYRFWNTKFPAYYKRINKTKKRKELKK